MLSELQWNGVRRLVALPERTTQYEGRVVDLPGRGSTYVTDIGPRDGPPLILLHALACTGLLTWYPVLDELSKRHRVVLFDQRWHGQRISPPGGSTLEDAADDVVAVADVLGIDAFVPVGYSLGSLVAQLTWYRHRERLAGLVLCATSSSFRRSTREKLAMRALDLMITTTRQQAENLAEIPPKAAPVPTEMEETYRWAATEFRSSSPRAVADAVAAVGRFDSSAWIGGVDVPTAVVINERDGIMSPRRQRWIARQIYGSTSYEVAGGHAACVLRSDVFRPALLAACTSVVRRVS